MTLREALQMNVYLVYSSIGFVVGRVAGLVDLTKPALFPALF
jgi:hypothetical protein